MLINTKDYLSRAELENFVSSLSGLTPDIKIHEIKGTTDDLARLQLSCDTLFWGIKCIATNPIVKQPLTTEKPNRGEIFNHGINLPADKKGKIK